MTYCTKCNDPILLSSCHGKCLRCWASDNLAAVREADAEEALAQPTAATSRADAAEARAEALEKELHSPRRRTIADT
jgi:hypothetical protein